MNRREFLSTSAALAATRGLTAHGSPALAEDPKPTAGDEMIHKYLAAEVERLSKNVLDGAKTKADWEAKRPQLHRQFLDMLGLDPLPERTPLKATVTGTLERGDVVVEKLHYQSRPGLYVTGNLYRPKASPDQKRPAILYVCGHSYRGRDGNKTAYADHGMWFARNGYVCLVVDTLQLGEIPGVHHGTYGIRGTNPIETRFWWHSRGYTPAGVECWNGIRGIDYLLSRPEVDPQKIGVTGISGGGATTVWVAAADERVKAAVPVSGMSDLESYVSHQVINGHCDCMFAYNTYRWEWATILALFAPKPLLFANSDADPIFPMDGNRRIIARLRQCYEMLGAKENVDEYVSKGGHAYRPDLRMAVFAFLNKHLKGDAGPVKDAEDPKIEAKELRVFPEDKDIPKDTTNGRADEVFVPKAEVKLPAEPKDFPAWKAGLVKQLRERSFRALPEKVTKAKELRSVPAGVATLSGEPGLEFQFTVLDAAESKKGLQTLVVFNTGLGADQAGDDFWRARYASASSCYAVHPRGGWTRKSPPNTVERSFVLLGQTADSGRVRDVMSVISGFDLGMKLRLTGRGPAGMIAAYAALFAPEKVSEVVILDPPTSHRDGPHFLNVMRVLDIPESLGLLAPDVTLTLIGKTAKDRAFDKTAAIYKLAGAEDKFKRE